MKKLFLTLFTVAATLSLNAAILAPQNEAAFGAPAKMEGIKQASPELQKEFIESQISALKANFAKAPKKALPIDGDATNLDGAYQFVYKQYTGGFTTQPDTLAADKVDQSYNNDLVGIKAVDNTNLRVTGLTPYPISATVDYSSYSVPVINFSTTDTIYRHSTYGKCILKGVFYYSGSETANAGWYYTTPIAFIYDSYLIMSSNVHYYMMIGAGNYQGSRLGWIYQPSAYFLPDTDYNGLMTYTYNNNYNSVTTWDQPVAISENRSYEVIVTNFAGVADSVSVQFDLAKDRTFAAPAGQVLYNSGSNTYVLYGVSGGYLVTDLSGTGDEKQLVFDTDWTGYDTNTNYWIGQRGAATIAYTDDSEFIYPPLEPTSLALNVDELTLKPGDTYQLEVTVTPYYADDAVVWSSSDETLATVDDTGLVTILSLDASKQARRLYDDTTGLSDEVTITATSVLDSNVTASVRIKVDNSSTGILDINAGKAVKAVKYYNAAGVASDAPFNGFNIVVKTYNDGTSSASKLVK